GPAAGKPVTAAERKHAENSLRQYNRRLEVLHSIDRGILTAQSSQSIAERVAHALTEMIPSDAIRIIAINSLDNSYPYLADYPPASQSSQDLLRQAIDRYGLPESFHRGESLLIDDVQTYADFWAGFEEVLTRGKVRAWLIVPLIYGEQLLGVLATGSLQPFVFTPEHVEIAREVADQLAIALHKHHLDEQIQEHARRLEARVMERTAELQRAKEQVEAILNQSGDAIVLAHSDSTFVQANPAFCQLLGYTVDEVLGKAMGEFADPSDTQFLFEALKNTIETKEPSRIEIILRRKNGSVFDADIALAPIVRSESPERSVIYSIRDNTIRKQAEQDLRAALGKEKELNELKSRFVSMVAHDFRSPLASIQSSSDLLNNYSERMTAEKKQHHFKTISSQIKNLTGILEDTLTISKDEAVGISLHPLPTDFVPYCQRIIDDMQLIDATRPIRLTVNGEVGAIEIDRDHLRRALVNLLSNAAKYSPEGCAIEFNVQSGNEQVILRIQDEGIGIPEADQSHLFEVFHRAGNVGDIPGTGLGLVIVKRAVEAHGGSITVESQVDLGTTFILALPVTQAKSTRHE
ncbi:MAG: ATP-binding protein, partial [Chloroflexota bacterium]